MAAHRCCRAGSARRDSEKVVDSRLCGVFGSGLTRSGICGQGLGFGSPAYVLVILPKHPHKPRKPQPLKTVKVERSASTAPASFWNPPAGET